MNDLLIDNLVRFLYHRRPIGTLISDGKLAMNVLHFSSYDTGGAGIAAYRLHKNLKAIGFNSKMAVLYKRNNDDSVIDFLQYSPAFRIKSLLTKSLFKFSTNQNYYFQNQTRFPTKIILNYTAKAGYRPDIIIAHWISNFLSIENLMELSKIFSAPVIWYLMDMAPLTGGCHYAWECVGYTKNCGRCPALYSRRNVDRSYKNWQKKHKYIQLMNIAAVPASKWLYKQTKNSSLFQMKSVEKIMLAVDPKIFKPAPSEVARDKLGLPNGKRIILFGSQGLKLKRKGMIYLFDALKILTAQYGFKMDSVMVAIAGEIKEARSQLDGAIQHKNIGFFRNDRMLASAYQAADLFVCPSIEDSGPMMINESIMCGTPVVSFDMGVAPDLVHTGVTGYRAELRDTADLAKGLKYILEQKPEESKRMSEQCRELGLRNCHPQVQVQAFKTLFDSLIH